MTTILVIDDCHPLVLALERMLKGAGYDVLAASGVRQGIELLRQRRVDLVITDLDMPEVSGVELLQFAQHEHLSMPFIAMSGNDWPMSTFRMVRSLGALFALKKPLTAERLIGTVEAALDVAYGSPYPPSESSDG